MSVMKFSKLITWHTMACIIASKPPSGLSKFEECVTLFTDSTKDWILDVKGRSLWKLYVGTQGFASEQGFLSLRVDYCFQSVSLKR